MRKSENIADLAKALNGAQAMQNAAKKDALNPFFKSRYATLESVWEACGEALEKNGLSIAQTVGFLPEAGPTLITTLLHISGQWIEGEQPLASKGLSPQELGSAISYARRYGLSAMLGIVEEDDDSEAAMNAAPRPQQSVPKPQGVASEAKPAPVISEAQRRRLMAIQHKSGMPDEAVKALIAKYGFASSKDISWTVYADIVSEIEKYKK